MTIFVDDSRDDRFSADRSQVGHVSDELRFDIRGPLPPGLMRPVAVIMDHVLAQHQDQVTFPEDQRPVQQFASEGPDDALADCIHPGRLRQGGDDPQSSGLEHLPERGGEQRIAIMDQEPHCAEAVTLWVPNILSPHATWAYSWIRPPTRSRLRTRAAGLIAGGCSRSSGGLWR